VGGVVGGIAGSAVGEAIYESGKKIVTIVADKIKSAGSAIWTGVSSLCGGIASIFRF